MIDLDNGSPPSRGLSLYVKYNVEAIIDGFEDGVYIRSSGT
jgi:hypothetical protein